MSVIYRQQSLHGRLAHRMVVVCAGNTMGCLHIHRDVDRLHIPPIIGDECVNAPRVVPRPPRPSRLDHLESELGRPPKWLISIPTALPQMFDSFALTTYNAQNAPYIPGTTPASLSDACPLPSPFAHHRRTMGIGLCNGCCFCLYGTTAVHNHEGVSRPTRRLTLACRYMGRLLSAW
jgi:hypothetical protein